MDGYFDNPEATAERYKTAGTTPRSRTFDADGYLSIVGRAACVIRSGGETISPVEIEQVLASHPTSRRSRSWAFRREVGRDRDRVRRRARPGPRAPDVDALRAWCANASRRSSIPGASLCFDALPRTPPPARCSAPSSSNASTPNGRRRAEASARFAHASARPSRRRGRGGLRAGAERFGFETLRQLGPFFTPRTTGVDALHVNAYRCAERGSTPRSAQSARNGSALR